MTESARYPTQVQHTIAIAQVALILQGARMRGIDGDQLLEAAGIAPTLLASPLARVTQAQYAALITVLRKRTRDEMFGLCSRPIPLGTFATGCRLLLPCQTLREALEAAQRYAHQVLPDFNPRLQVEDGVATWRISPRSIPRGGSLGDAQAYAQRMFMFFSFGVACWLVARRIPLLEDVHSVGLSTSSCEASRLFQAPVRQEAHWTGLRFEEKWLDLPVVQTRESLQQFLHEAPGNLLLKYRDQASLTERIRRLLRRHLHEEMPSLEDVADSLAMTPQTLRRRLQREGQGFQAIKDSLRRDVAVEYLSRPDLTLIEIATRLGYSEASTFHRAFKAWTGLAPGAYRERHLATTPAQAAAAEFAGT